MTITDIITLLSCVFLIWRGASQGFLGSVIGPLALIFAIIVSIIYYSYTNNIIVSLCIGLFGPLILTWIFKFFLRSWNKMANPRGELSSASRIGGAFLTWGWGMAMLIITILLLVMVPPMNKPLEVMYNDLHMSFIYRIIKPLDSSAIDKPTVQEVLKTFSQDQKIQDIINDPEITEALQHKNYAKFLSDPKIKDLIKDPAMIKRMLVIYKQMQQHPVEAQ